MTKEQWAEARQTGINAEKIQKEMAQMGRAYKIHQEENEARPGSVKIQANDVDFVRQAVQAPDVNQFLDVV